MAFLERRGGGRRWKGGDGWEGLGKRVGGEDRLALGKQVTTAIGSCSHNGRPVVLDRAQVNTYGGVMIQDAAAAHNLPHTRAKGAILMFTVVHEC